MHGHAPCQASQESWYSREIVREAIMWKKKGIGVSIMHGKQGIKMEKSNCFEEKLCSAIQER